MRLLVISYFSPADKITGGFRAVSFTKYFPEAGIDISLITSNSKIKDDTDMIQKYNLKTVEITRSIRIRNIGYKIKVLALLELLKLDSFLFFPDIFRFWNRRALKKCQKMLDEQKMDAILVTAPPHSSFYFAAKLAKKNNLPLILDYRDPLSGSPYMFFPPIIKQLVRRKEKKIVNEAKILVTVGEECAKLISDTLSLKDRPIQVIYNGYYEEDKLEVSVEKSNKFTISYFGHFYTLRQKGFEALARGIKLLVTKYNLSPEDIALQYAGKTSRKTLQKILDSAGIADYFNDLGLLSNETLFREISKSILNVVLIPPKTTYTLPTKIYDYAYSNSHILLIGEEGEVSKWCKKVDQQYTHAEIEPEKLTETLWKLYSEWKTGSLNYGCDFQKLKTFSRKNLAIHYAEIIKHELGS
ncbi:MAG: glycosyltransferase [Candidatus Heimdallarchaeota archaeon]|nr:glycosyltransferase [Candidatus Heimdallarchaeota archaeon]